MRVFYRVKEGFDSSDAKAFAFVLGGRRVGNAWVEDDLSPRQIEALQEAGIFQIVLNDPRPGGLRGDGRRLVKLIEPTQAKRRLVVLTGTTKG